MVESFFTPNADGFSMTKPLPTRCLPISRSSRHPSSTSPTPELPTTPPPETSIPPPAPLTVLAPTTISAIEAAHSSSSPTTTSTTTSPTSPKTLDEFFRERRRIRNSFSSQRNWNSEDPGIDKRGVVGNFEGWNEIAPEPTLPESGRFFGNDGLLRRGKMIGEDGELVDLPRARTPEVQKVFVEGVSRSLSVIQGKRAERVEALRRERREKAVRKEKDFEGEEKTVSESSKEKRIPMSWISGGQGKERRNSEGSNYTSSRMM